MVIVTKSTFTGQYANGISDQQQLLYPEDEAHPDGSVATRAIGLELHGEEKVRAISLLLIGMIGVAEARAQQLPKSQVFLQNVEAETVAIGLSCDDRQSWKPVTLKGHERQRFECDSRTAKMWAHVNTDLQGEAHQESELQIESGSRYDVYFDQSSRKWTVRQTGDSITSTPTGSISTSTNEELKIRSVHEAWVAAMRERNVQNIVNLVTDDCVFLMSSKAPLFGKEDVRKAYEKLFSRYASGGIDEDSKLEEIQVLGDTAFWRSTDNITVRTGSAPTDKLKFYSMGLMRRGPDGMWRFARAMNMMPE